VLGSRHLISTGWVLSLFFWVIIPANTTDPNAPPGIFTAAQEQLGLKFEPTKALVDVLVIDRAEMPSPN